MTNVLIELKAKLHKKYEAYKENHKGNLMEISGYQDCAIDVINICLELLEKGGK